MVDDVDPVGEALGLLHVVRGEHDGDARRRAAPRAAPTSYDGRRGPCRRSARRRTRSRAARRSPSPARAAAAGRRRAGGTACGRSRRARAGRTSSVEVERVGVQPGDVAQHLVGAHAAPGAAALEHHADPGEQRAPVAHRVEPEHAHRPRLRAPVALGGLERRGLAGAVGAEHGGDRCRARRSGDSPSTATLSPYRMTSPSISTAGLRPRGGETGADTPPSVGSGRSPRPRHVGLVAVVRAAASNAAGGSRHTSERGCWISRQTRSGGAGQVDVLDPEVLERVDDGVLHGRRRADGRGLADALGADRVHRRRASRCWRPRA